MMNNYKKVYKTVAELKKDEILNKKDLELIIAYRRLELLNPDYLPIGELLRFEDVNYLFKDSENKFYLLSLVSDYDNRDKEEIIEEKYFVVMKMTHLQITNPGGWQDETERLYGIYDYKIPKGKDKHLLRITNSKKKYLETNYFNIRDYQENNPECRVDFLDNRLLTDRMESKKITGEDLFDLAEEVGILGKFVRMYNNLLPNPSGW